jgi:hypothetical protein
MMCVMPTVIMMNIRVVIRVGIRVVVVRMIGIRMIIGTRMIRTRMVRAMVRC